MIGIYKITNLINNKCYIGQSINIQRRWREHRARRGSSPLYKDMKIYGVENFSFEVIEECHINELNTKEIYWIKYYNSFYNGYNRTPGGQTRNNIIKGFKKPYYNDFLLKLDSSDNVYIWLLLHSHSGQKAQFIYKRDFTFKQIGNDLEYHRDTVSKKFKKLIENHLLELSEHNRKKIYNINFPQEFKQIDKNILSKLLSISIADKREELIRTFLYVYIYKKQKFLYPKSISVNLIILGLQHSNGHYQIFDKIRQNLLILQKENLV